MLNLNELVIEGFKRHLLVGYRHLYSDMEPTHPGIIEYVVTMALESIANGDALYHDLSHTIQVTLVGHEILRGKHLTEGGVTPSDWLQVIVALLCHDIGYVRGVLRHDRPGKYQDGVGGMVRVALGTTDAALTPFHVDRSKQFVRERFGGHPVVDAARVEAYIEATRFPPPEPVEGHPQESYASLVCSADLIGQLADPDYLRKLPALFYEMVESGVAAKFRYAGPGELRARYPQFFWETVKGHIDPAIAYLLLTQEGKQWVANLHSHVFRVEHGLADAPARATG